MNETRVMRVVLVLDMHCDIPFTVRAVALSTFNDGDFPFGSELFTGESVR